MRLGLLSYINSLPVTYGLECGEVAFEGTTCRAEPSVLNRMVVEGELDVTAVSSIEFARNRDRLALVPGFCLASDGEVQSVRLFSTVPLAELKGRKVWMTGASATSRVLAQVLVPGLEPVDGEGLPVLDGRAPAVLRIGDRALEDVEGAEFVYDLGALWQAATGLPMVFAVWVASRDYLDRGGDLEKVAALLKRSYDWGKTHRPVLLAEAQARTGFPAERLRPYYACLFYRMTPEARLGLDTFYERARTAGYLTEKLEVGS